MLAAHRMMLKMSDLDAAPNEYGTITATKIIQNLRKERYTIVVNSYLMILNNTLKFTKKLDLPGAPRPPPASHPPTLPTPLPQQSICPRDFIGALVSASRSWTTRLPREESYQSLREVNDNPPPR